ncbi:hypothetical protein M5K25_008299 [Dendrobium thyrsiflorum]|uniref:Uncharacterized protein n=1 Tax=Dendrobium thyrsiflorum TaxID=117978 RepID=A0ABD0V837_DENTH
MVELEREKSLGEGVWRGFYTVAPASSHRSTSMSRFVLREVLKKKTALVSKDQVLFLLQEEEKGVRGFWSVSTSSGSCCGHLLHLASAAFPVGSWRLMRSTGVLFHLRGGLLTSYGIPPLRLARPLPSWEPRHGALLVTASSAFCCLLVPSPTCFGEFGLCSVRCWTLLVFLFFDCCVSPPLLVSGSLDGCSGRLRPCFFPSYCVSPSLRVLGSLDALEMFLQFLSNLRVIPDFTRLTSFVMQQKVTIKKEDLGTFLHLRTEGDRLHTLIQESDISWSLVNDTLRGNKDKYHQPRVYTLLQNARIIQHVLRSSIIPKAGDRVNMTPLLSVVTHLIMSGKPFDEAQLILDYIHSLFDIRHPQTKRKKNIAIGHLVCYILEKKYNLIYPEPPTEEPIFFTNASFRSLIHDPSVEGDDSEGEKEVPPELAPVPNQNAYQDMIQRFGTMETNFGQRDLAAAAAARATWRAPVGSRNRGQSLPGGAIIAPPAMIAAITRQSQAAGRGSTCPRRTASRAVRSSAARDGRP